MVPLVLVEAENILHVLPCRFTQSPCSFLWRHFSWRANPRSRAGIVVPVLAEAAVPASDSAEVVGDGSLGLQL